MAEPWEEALDLDDSDLSSLRPFKRQNHHTTSAAASSQSFLQRCSTSQSSELPSQNPQFHPPPSASPRLIPGPAGTVQTAMIRRRSNRNDENFSGDPIPTQEYIRRVVEDGVAEDDDDFTHEPWLCAVDFIRSQGLAYGDGAIGTPLSAIKSRSNMDKVAQVIAIIKSCTPNGLGDMMVTLKDPTGTIDAAIHRRVLTEGGFGKDIYIGSVIIIQKVTVFSPSRSVHYLNITLGNMVKVISKEGRFSLTQIYPAPAVKHAVPASEYSERIRMPEKPLSLSQGKTDGIMNSLRQNANRIGSSHDDEQMERNRTRGIGNNEKDQNDFASREPFANQNVADEAMEVVDGTDTDDNGIVVCDKLYRSSQADRCNMLEGTQYGNAAAGSVNVFKSQEIGKVDGTKGTQPPTSRVRVPQWTDEQLDKLFELD